MKDALATVVAKSWCPLSSPGRLLIALVINGHQADWEFPAHQRGDGEFPAHHHGDVAIDHFGAGNPGLDGHGRLNGQATPALDEGIAGERMRTLRKRTAGHPERKEV